jgi:hypothetical protein
MNHYCKICKYSTNSLYNYKRHINSKIHKENEIMTFECFDCNKKFVYETAYNNHIQKYHKKNEINPINILTKMLLLEQENKFLKEKNEIENKLLKEKTEILIEKNELEVKLLRENKKELSKTKDKHIEYLQQTNIETSRMAHSSQLSAINFASMYYNKPIGMIGVDKKEQYIDKGLRKLPDMKRWIKNKPELADQYVAEKLIVLYSNDKFIDYICSVIHNAYKTEDPIDQTIWSTDVSRLVYIVRSTIENENKLENKWEYDKKGIKIKQSIIDPLLDEVQDIINKYLDEMNKLSKSDKKFDTFAKLEMVGIGNTIIHELKNRLSLKNQIIKSMAPLFFLERTVKQIEYIELPKNNNNITDIKLVKKKK